MSVKVTDHGYKALTRRVFGDQALPMAVGVFEANGSKTYEDGMTVLEVATIHEFGTSTIPERSFIRAYFDENQTRIRKMMTALMGSVIEGKRTKEQVLEILGQKLVGEIQARIAARIPPPLAPETVRRKGSDVPLIDTGQLRSSITYKVDPDDR